RAAAVRETREELGLALDLTGVRPALSLSFEQGFDDFYLLTRPLDPSSLSLQREEVAEVRWAEEGEILRMIGEGTFIPYEKGLISLLFCLWSRRDAHTKPDPTRGETRADGDCGGIVLFK
ncbi:MAG: NUDIX domain-containing protein, partial [Clostridia bacterium]|nr:NUDIX domain-containing protein [Clostridia bacterium]